RVDPVDILHVDPQLLVLEPTIVDRDDVRVVEAGDELALPFEPGPQFLVGEGLAVQQLEGRAAGQARVPGEVHRAHSALAEQLLHAVAGEDGPRLQHWPPVCRARVASVLRRRLATGGGDRLTSGVTDGTRHALGVHPAYELLLHRLRAGIPLATRRRIQRDDVDVHPRTERLVQLGAEHVRPPRLIVDV